MKRILAIMLLGILSSTITYALEEGKYVLGVTISGLAEGTLVMSNCKIVREDGVYMLQIQDKHNEKFTMTASTKVRMEIGEVSNKSTITFSVKGNPTPHASTGDMGYSELYTGKVSSKIGYIGGTVTGTSAKGKRLDGKWILLRVKGN
jgi:hypothetical protein